MGSVIASATVLGAHFMFRTPGGIFDEDSDGVDDAVPTAAMKSPTRREATLLLPDGDNHARGHPRWDGDRDRGGGGLTWDIKLPGGSAVADGPGREEQGVQGDARTRKEGAVRGLVEGSDSEDVSG